MPRRGVRYAASRHVDDVGVTQVRTLDRAARQVEDFIETITGEPVDDFSMDIRFSLGGLEDDVAEARRLVAEAAALQVEAGQRARVVARRLRREKHLSVTDTAAVLGVSRGRVSQLTV